MKKKPTLFFVFIFLLFFPFIPLKTTKAYSVIGTEYHFFISEPGTVKFPQMYVNVYNNQEEPIMVMFEPEIPEGINLDVFFEFNETYLYPGEHRVVHYWFEIHENFQTTVNIQLKVSQIELESGNNIILGSIAITNKLTFYSPVEGYFLNVQVRDRNNDPRYAQITMLYKPNNSVSFTPMKIFNGTEIRGYFPKGIYLVHAIDVETNRIGEITFGLSERTTVILPIYLVGFGLWEYINPDYNNESVGVVASIYNYLGDLDEVYVYAEMYHEGILVTTSNKDYRESFGKTTGLALKFNFQPMVLEKGTYNIIGRIDSKQRMIQTSWERIEFILEAKYYPKSLRPELNYISLFFFAGFVVFFSLFIITNIYNIYSRRRLKNEIKKSIDNNNGSTTIKTDLDN